MSFYGGHINRAARLEPVTTVGRTRFERKGRRCQGDHEGIVLYAKLSFEALPFMAYQAYTQSQDDPGHINL